MMNDQDFRTCTITGLKVNRAAESLIKANAVTAIIFLIIGGIAAIAVALTRWPAVHLLPADMYYRLLTAHGLDMLIVWIIFFEIAALYFGSAVLLNSRLAAPKLAWLAYILMLVGAVITNIMVVIGKGEVLFTSFSPFLAHPLFYVGIILFAVGSFIVSVIFFVSLYVSRKENVYPNSIFPLVTFGLG